MLKTRGSDRAVCAIVACLFLVFVATVADAASPGVEVKFFLDPSEVLDASDRPSDDLRATFNVATDHQVPPIKMSMQFLESVDHDLNREGWNIRFRKTQRKDKVEITFKRRIALSGPDSALIESAIDGVVVAEYRAFEAELEVGYATQTLTFSYDKRSNDEEEESLDLPKIAMAREVTGSKMPDKLLQWKHPLWATSIVAEACLYGPVVGTRWNGKYAAISDDISLEVWTVPTEDDRTSTERIVEISFKEPEYNEQAILKREKLKSLLDEKGWLRTNDVLKTKLILERYHPAECR